MAFSEKFAVYFTNKVRHYPNTVFNLLIAIRQKSINLLSEKAARKC